MRKSKKNKKRLNLRQILKKGQLDNIVVIGFDFGDGSDGFAMVEDGVVKPKTIGPKLYQKPNIISCYEEGENYEKKLCTWKLDLKPLTDYKVGARCYCNFKCAPDSNKFRQKYVFLDENGEVVGESCYTNGELMERAFQVAVSAIIGQEGDNIGNKRILLVVGCPSGGLWEAGRYADFLKNALDNGVKNYKEGKNELNLASLGVYCKSYQEKTGETEFPIDVIVIPESNAAVAYETKNRFKNIKSYIGKIIILVDMGSSTLDFTLVVDGKIEDTYTRNLGGEQIERLMVAPMMKVFKEEYAGEKFVDPSYVKFGLRMAKERFFGEYGKDHQLTSFNAILESGNECEIAIGKNFMTRVMSEIKETKVYGSMMYGIKDLTDLTVTDAYRLVFTEARERFENTLNKMGREYKPDSVIATGGVSVVAELQAILCDVFNVKQITAEEPDGELAGSKSPQTSVACGLAQVGDMEFKKLKEIYELEETIEEPLEKICDDILTKVADVFAERELAKVEESLNSWVYKPDKQTLEDWFDDYTETEIDKTDSMEDAIRDTWDEDVESSLNELVEEHFKKLFGEGLNVPFNLSGMKNVVKKVEECDILKPTLDLVDYFGHESESFRYRTCRRATTAGWFSRGKIAFLEDFKKEDTLKGAKEKIRNKYFYRICNTPFEMNESKYNKELKAEEDLLEIGFAMIMEEGVDNNFRIKDDEHSLRSCMIKILKETVMEQIEVYIDSLTMYFYMNKER